jgi:cysteinyl-tRNA synthetase
MGDLVGVPFPYDATRMPACPESLKGTWVQSSLANSYKTDGTVAKLKSTIDLAANYAKNNGVDIFCGEFGVYNLAVLSLAELQTSNYYQTFVAAMNDDFNTRVALAGMYDLVRDLNNAAKTDSVLAINLAAQLKTLGNILGILQEQPEAFLQAGASDGIAAEEVERLVAERIAAKQNKNYARADEIRKLLLSEGVVLEDSREGGTQWRRE